MGVHDDFLESDLAAIDNEGSLVWKGVTYEDGVVMAPIGMNGDAWCGVVAEGFVPRSWSFRYGADEGVTLTLKRAGSLRVSVAEPSAWFERRFLRVTDRDLATTFDLPLPTIRCVENFVLPVGEYSGRLITHGTRARRVGAGEIAVIGDEESVGFRIERDAGAWDLRLDDRRSWAVSVWVSGARREDCLRWQIRRAQATEGENTGLITCDDRGHARILVHGVPSVSLSVEGSDGRLLGATVLEEPRGADRHLSCVINVGDLGNGRR